ncbi:hypothetical protein FGO68_gene8400 [Halteria grandinella]|uniref:Uncharacterized protein n=1 Tax=Halteria grandinella TaxID=5974 RepID=A0A8J8SZR9_HALGN|nr:hypothetical protein FGO68_gene8400 [Halteria grandinella]
MSTAKHDGYLHSQVVSIKANATEVFIGLELSCSGVQQFLFMKKGSKATFFVIIGCLLLTGQFCLFEN